MGSNVPVKSWPRHAILSQVGWGQPLPKVPLRPQAVGHVMWIPKQELRGTKCDREAGIDMEGQRTTLKTTSSALNGWFKPPSVWAMVLTTGKFPLAAPIGDRHDTSIAVPRNLFGTSDTSQDSSDTSVVRQQIPTPHISFEISHPRTDSDCKKHKHVLTGDHEPTSAQATSPSLHDTRCSNEAASLDDGLFHPLSLRCIMNDDSVVASLGSPKVAKATGIVPNANFEQQSSSSAVPVSTLSSTKKPARRGLKQADYLPYSTVRRGRWSAEEERYARAMIEAFECAYLPLRGSVSLRKFLSAMLVCHPMRVSKKFVGYVHKYSWYRMKAVNSDPDAKRQALRELCCLEEVFWASVYRRNEWPSNLR